LPPKAASKSAPKGDHVNLRFIDWIWHVRGSLALAPGQSSDDVFNRLDSLFGQAGTSHERTSDTLVFRKKDQAAQDKMSVFDDGHLQIERGAIGKGVAAPVLRYDLTSRILLFCFLAPVLFVGIAQLTIVMGKLEKPSAEAAGKSGKASDASKKAARKKAEVPMNPIDKALGAPAPEKPGKKDADKAEGRNKKPSPTPAYVFAAIFATLYVVGRVLEDRLVKTLFKKRLLGS
jgi:hypothetical protein